MKRVILFSCTLIMLLGLSSAIQAGNRSVVPAIAKDRVEVLYFHGAQRCVTCRSIEKATQEVLDTYFRAQVKSGKIVYKIIDISKSENEKIADNYEVTWSSLFVNGWKKGKETRNNLTEFAFSYAKNTPEQFKAGLKKKIIALLQ